MVSPGSVGRLGIAGRLGASRKTPPHPASSNVPPRTSPAEYRRIAETTSAINSTILAGSKNLAGIPMDRVTADNGKGKAGSFSRRRHDDERCIMVFRSLKNLLWPRQPGPLFHAVNGLARSPELFTRFGLSDTPNGRFEALSLVLSLVVHHLDRHGESGRTAAQTLLDEAFSALDHGLRELGTGDLSVPKKIRRLAEGHLGRARSYEAGLAAAHSGDLAPLADALARNAQGLPPGAPVSLALAGWVVALDARLAGLAPADLLAGRFDGPVQLP
jgi:cytochrome b pre-mRNA-processing protein 3